MAGIAYKRAEKMWSSTYFEPMKKFIIDCTTVASEMDVWEKYVQVTQPEGADCFGYNLDAFRDAVTAGGPGWPGECEIHFVNTSRLQKFRSGEFYERLQNIASESTTARICLEAPMIPKKRWWQIG